MAAVLLSNLARAKREYTEEDTSQASAEGVVRGSFDQVETDLQSALDADESNLEGWHTLLDNRVDAMDLAMTAEESARATDYSAYNTAKTSQKSAVVNYGDNVVAGEVAVGALETGEMVINGGSIKIDSYTLAAVVVSGVPYLAVS